MPPESKPVPVDNVQVLDRVHRNHDSLTLRHGRWSGLVLETWSLPRSPVFYISFLRLGCLAGSAVLRPRPTTQRSPPVLHTAVSP
jgi:hypothetical protein